MAANNEAAPIEAAPIEAATNDAASNEVATNKTSFEDLPPEVQVMILKAALPYDFESLALTCKANYSVAKEHLASEHAHNVFLLRNIGLAISLDHDEPSFSFTDHYWDFLRQHLPMTAITAIRDDPYTFFSGTHPHYVETVQIELQAIHKEPTQRNYFAFLAWVELVTGCNMPGPSADNLIYVSKEQCKTLVLESVLRVFPNVSTFIWHLKSRKIVEHVECDIIPRLDMNEGAICLLQLKTLTIAPIEDQRRGKRNTMAIQRLFWVLELPNLRFLDCSGLSNSQRRSCLATEHHHPQFSLRAVRLSFSAFDQSKTEATALFISQMIHLETCSLTSQFPTLLATLQSSGKSIKKEAKKYRQQTLDRLNE